MSREHHIVLVGAEPSVASSLGRLLSAHDRRVHSVDAAGAAAAVWGDGPRPALVLVDLDGTPRGRRLVRELRARDDTRLVPLLILSSSRELEQECLALGADGFLVKPLAYPTLRAQVDRHLARRVRWGLAPELDPVTGLPTRSVALSRLTATEGHVSPDRRVFVALVAPDRLGAHNRRFGREFGDSALRTVVTEMRQALPGAHLFRWTGAQVLAVFRAPTPDTAHLAVSAAAARLAAVELRPPQGGRVRVTVSAGVGELTPSGGATKALAEAEYWFDAAARSGVDHVRSSTPHDSGTQGRILVAEDDEVTATVIRHRLAKAGFEVEHYDNGRAAYEGARRSRADLVISDVKMPGMDGFELLRRLRQHPDYVDVPIILLSTMNREADIVRGLEHGASDYVVKPFSPHELVARVERLLGLVPGGGPR